ncbi:elongin C [Entomophthora muscae]|uniref:Elongin C n=2 Tax=Entomophthora muscae TaxID=34485 RepID=A0ACC2S1A3_9FUNG|nr:elongin C [Entomophthora muscae]KAJ9076704.1 elongin C [Entomophthora muscae]
MDEQSSEIRFVKLISSDGFEIVLDKDVAMGARTIKNMLSGSESFLESSTNEIHFRDISGIILEKVADYLHYKARYSASPGYDLPQLQIETEIALELLMAADFLEV